MILRRHLFTFGTDFPSGGETRREMLEDKGFVPADEEEERTFVGLGKNLRRSWRRWITVT